MKILNLYACLGGNRYKWNEVKEDIEVTAIELDPELARLYQERFLNDTVIIADAHQYLLDHYKEYDFIWSSPPCPTHSRINTSYKNQKNQVIRYAKMELYQEIILLMQFFDGKYCIENVIPYYEPLIEAKKRGRHLYWTNFNLPNILSKRKTVVSGNMNDSLRKRYKHESDVKRLSKFHDYDFTKYKGKQRMDKVARNLVDYEAGKTILETVIGITTSENINQKKLF
mgnify:CR=1 FL=1